MAPFAVWVVKSAILTTQSETLAPNHSNIRCLGRQKRHFGDPISDSTNFAKKFFKNNEPAVFLMALIGIEGRKKLIQEGEKL